MKSRILGLLAVGLLVGPMAARAVPITWTVDVQLSNGGSVSGSYVYDASTNTFSNVMVSAVGGTFPASSANLTSMLIPFSYSTALDFVPTVPDLTGYEDVYLLLASPMTDAGGTINVTTIARFVCTDSTCNSYNEVENLSQLARRATVSSVPEPGTLALLGLGLAGLGLGRRRKA